MKNIKLIEVPSEIGAGTRGASLGIDAIKIAALDWAEAERPGGANAPTDPALLHGEEVFFNQCV